VPVRTQRLAVGNSAATGVTQTVYVCPAGRTAIVKDIRLNWMQGGDLANSLVAIGSGPTFLFLFKGTVTAGGVAVLQRDFVVLEPGDRIDVRSDTAGTICWWVSGTELDGLAP
jgi:hypothetical protein